MMAGGAVVRAAAVGLALLYSAPAIAGGSATECDIRRFAWVGPPQRMRDAAVFTVALARTESKRGDETFTIVDDAGRVHRCAELEVRARYDASELNGVITLEQHLQALDALQKAAAEHTVIGFGSIGTGYKPITAGLPCVVESRGLESTSDKTPGGGNLLDTPVTAYSYYKRP